MRGWRVVEKRKEVERMKGVVGEIREESLGRLREDWRREKEAMREWEEAARREREKLRREMEGQMEEMRRKMEELRETVGGEDREERRHTQRGPWGGGGVWRRERRRGWGGDVW